jgi:hypothetical protein
MTRRWLGFVFAMSSAYACGGEVLVGPDLGRDGGGGMNGGGGSSIGGAGGFAGAAGAAGSAGAGGSSIGGEGGFAGAAGAAGSAGAGGAGGGVIDSGVITSDATVPGAPTIGTNGYLSIEAGAYVLVGYVSSFVGGSSSSILLTFNSTSFCASGTVATNGSFQSYAGAGFDTDQPQSPTGWTVSSLLLSGTSMTVSFANPGDSPLELQLNSGTNAYWCYELAGATSPVTIPLTSFNTQCWDDDGQSFVPGTAITSIDLVVPGSATSSTPYNFCFLGLTIQ